MRCKHTERPNGILYENSVTAVYETCSKMVASMYLYGISSLKSDIKTGEVLE